jgi:hypothetical protein
MKIALIVPGDLELQPYLFYYTDILDCRNIEYEYIYFARNSKIQGVFNNKKATNLGTKSPIEKSIFIKIIHYYIYSKAVRRYLINNDFDYLFVYTLPNAIFLKSFLLKNYRNKFVFDIRDYSVMTVFFKNSIEALVSNSLFTAISSKGFLTWLPKNYNYVLSHNTAKSSLFYSGYDDICLNLESFKILNIGRIRDYATNKRIIERLGNKKNIQIVIAGVSFIKDALELYFDSKYNNLTFTGSYTKNEELLIVNSASFLNLILPNDISSRTLMANRFYLGVICRRPLIVSETSYIASTVEEFNLGIVLKSNDDLHDAIIEYVKNFDKEIFEKGCNDLIDIIHNDVLVFESKLINSLKVI